MDKYSVTCPCCDAVLTVDAATGALLGHEEKKSFIDNSLRTSKKLSQVDSASPLIIGILHTLSLMEFMSTTLVRIAIIKIGSK